MQKFLLDSIIISREEWEEYQRLKGRNKKMNSGVYIRVGTENKLLEQMTEEERHEWLKKFTEPEPLVRCIDILSNTLKWYEDNYETNNEE